MGKRVVTALLTFGVSMTLSARARCQAQAVVWTETWGASASGSRLTKVGPTGWNAGGLSTKSIAAGDGYVEFVALSANSDAVCGLARGSRGQGYLDIDFAIRLASDGHVEVVEEGAPRLSAGAYAAGDRFRVAVEAGVVRYYRNGAALYSSARAVIYPLTVDASLYTPGAAIADATLSGELLDNVVWTSAVNATANGHDLEKTSGADGDWDAGALSSKAIVSLDGYVEVTACEASQDLIFGLLRGDPDASYAQIAFALHLTAGTVRVLESGEDHGQTGTFVAGDRLRVALEAGQVHYRKNGELLYASTVTPDLPLLVGASLSRRGSALTDAVLSGEFVALALEPPVFSIPAGNYLEPLSVVITAADPEATIHFTTTGADPNEGDPVAAAGETLLVAESRTLRARAFRAGMIASSVTAARYAFGDEAAKVVFWTNLVGVAAAGNDLKKTATTTAWDSGASSVQELHGDGYVEFAVQETNKRRVVGLSQTDASQTIQEIDFGFNLGSGGGLAVFESGALRGTFGGYAAGDRLRVAVESGVVSYYRNGARLYTSSVVPSFPLRLDAAFLHSGGTVADAVVFIALTAPSAPVPVISGPAFGDTGAALAFDGGSSWDADGAVVSHAWDFGDGQVATGPAVTHSYAQSGAYALTLTVLDDRGLVATETRTVTIGEPVFWTNLVGVAASGSDLVKTATTTAWDSGASSVAELTGDGYVDFLAQETNKRRVVGLSRTDASRAIGEIAFGFNLGQGGGLAVFESGVSRGTFTGYATGDRLRIAVESWVVKYYRNGVLLYTSGVTPTFPLRVDTAFLHPGGTATDVSLFAAPAPAVALFSAPVPGEMATTYLAQTPAAGVGRQLVLRRRTGDVLAERIVDEKGAPTHTPRLVLNLFDDVTLTAVLHESSRNKSGSVTWQGAVLGDPWSSVTLTTLNGLTAASIMTRDHTYRLRYVQGRTHAIEEIDPRALPPDGPDVLAPASDDASDGATASLGTDAAATALAASGAVIDILVVYTPSAAAYLGGSESGLVVQLENAVAEANGTYRDGQRIQLACTGRVDYDETGFNWDTALGRLRGSADGYMDVVHDMRGYCGADVVVMVVADGYYHGLAYLMAKGQVNHGFAANAFALVHAGALTGNYTLAHELGHIMGANHDRYAMEKYPQWGHIEDAAFPYAFGFVNLEVRWRTIMAYNDACSDSGFDCPRYGWWSDPLVLYQCPEDANNRLTIAQTAGIVAGFRSPPVCGNEACEVPYEHCADCTADCGTCDGSGGHLGPCREEMCVGRCGAWTCTEPATGVDRPAQCPSCPCGDNRCESGETCVTCPGDCGSPCCGNHACEDGESATSCPEDCGCGNGTCDSRETIANCLQDCLRCGDGRCDSPETATSCPQDCGCGNGKCDNDETCSSCAKDCPQCCGDRTCDTSSEHCSTCSTDCGACNGSGGSLGNCASLDKGKCVGRCGTWSCEHDHGTQTVGCPPCPCGNSNGICDNGETCSTCPQECESCCGNGQCDNGETIATCPGDCVRCGDGRCDSPETVASCPEDCTCGNAQCDHGETCHSCAADCRSCCGDGTCDTTNEHCSTCPADCGTCDSSGGSVGACPSAGDDPCIGRCGSNWSCTHDHGTQTMGCPLCPCGNGNGVCDNGETCSTCPRECGSCCGNGRCDNGETIATCPGDCVRCGDGKCDSPETAAGCPQDCACGDGQCNYGETIATCPGDCIRCGDGKCDSPETTTSCAQDCGCGNGKCDNDENCHTCAADCSSCCGDGTCDTNNEHCSTCSADCGTCDSSGGSLGACPSAGDNPCIGRCGGNWSCTHDHGTQTMGCPPCP